jgi:hypothetical protein
MSAAQASRTSEVPSSNSPDPPQRLALDGDTKPTRTALLIAPGIAYSSWKHVGAQLALISDSSSWWLGDWIVYGQGQYGSRYRDALETTHLDYQTLRNYAWVARKFDPVRRRQALSFQHHLEVAGLAALDQDTWLDRAEINRWSKSQLRHHLKVGRIRADHPPVTVVDTLTISVESNRRKRWDQAAAADAHDLRTWILGALDEAATRVLPSETSAGPQVLRDP